LEQATDLDRTRSWEALDGISLTSEIRAAIAVPACVLTANIGLEWFRDVSAILVEPTSSVRPMRHDVGGGIISEGSGHVLGQALVHGPVRLAWAEIARDARSAEPKSVVLHEFAHKIDMSDGVVDGTPAIVPRSDARAFEATLDRTLADLRHGRHTGPLRMYGATNRSELFAVATEAFFLAGAPLLDSDPDLYTALAGFYRQDTAITRTP
jgi:Mlc titration factor MtfA (ptsG expression regulator)